MNQHGEISRNLLIGFVVSFSVASLAMFLPFLTLPLRVLTPLPILYYRSKLGREKGLLLLLTTSLIITIIFGKTAPCFLVILSLMFIGFVLGELLEKKFSIEKTLLLSSGIVVLFVILCLFFYAKQANISTISLVYFYIDGNISSFLQICKDAGITNEITAVLEQRREQIINSAIIIMPSSTVIIISVIEWINILIAKHLMKKNNLSYPDFGKLNQWSAPENLIWWLIVFTSTLLIGGEKIQIISINGLLIIMSIYFFQGIAITSFYLKKKRIPIVAKIAIYSVIAINQILLITIVGIGIFDVWFNFRKIEARRSDSDH